MIRDSLLVKEDPIAAKVARLYLVSDILHNTAAPVKHASHFRTHIQAFLPEIFESFGMLLRDGSLGRLTSGQLGERVSRVLSVWEDWSLFPTTYLNGLEAFFNMTEAEASAVKAQIDLLSTTNSDEEKKVPVDDLESLRRKARLYGVPYTRRTTEVEILARLEYAEKYTAKKNARVSTGAVGGASDNGVGTGADSSSGSGAAVSSSSSSSHLSASAAVHRGRWEADYIDDYNENDNDNDDEDDVDGVPLDAGSAITPASTSFTGRPRKSNEGYGYHNSSGGNAGAGPDNNTGDKYNEYSRYAYEEGDSDADNDDEDDVDGVPLDIGGHSSTGPLGMSTNVCTSVQDDDDDVDGVPLDLPPAQNSHQQSPPRKRTKFDAQDN
jgi:hypothetical protein